MTHDEHRAYCILTIADALYIPPDEAAKAFDALHGIVIVAPIEATEEMIDGVDLDDWSVSNAWRAMSKRGDLTNAPEEKT